jgi:hypothetical protein
MNATGLVQKLSGNCLDPTRESGSWQDFSTHAPFRYTRVFEGVGLAVHGTFDPAARTGTLTGSGRALRIDNYNAHSRAIRIGSFGLRVSGARATVTGRIGRTRTIYARSGRARALLRLTRVRFQSGPFQRGGKDVADTFVMGMTGRATVAPFLARELNRIRCRGPHIVTSHPIRPGAAFGSVKVQLRPDAATGLGGVFELDGFTAVDDDTGAPLLVTPTAPARRAGRLLRFDLPADARTRLRCEASYACTPEAGSQYAPAGGFVISLGDRSTTVANLMLVYEDVRGTPAPVLTATLDGVPVTVVGGAAATGEFADRVTMALGADSLRIGLVDAAAHFSRTAAP